MSSTKKRSTTKRGRRKKGPRLVNLLPGRVADNVVLRLGQMDDGRVVVLTNINDTVHRTHLRLVSDE